MEIIHTEDFSKALSRLPSSTQRLYKVQEKRFLSNPRDPRLHTKKLRDLSGVLSFRVTRNYRVLFYLTDTGTAVFFAVGDRKDIYRQ